MESHDRAIRVICRNVRRLKQQDRIHTLDRIAFKSGAARSTVHAILKNKTEAMTLLTLCRIAKYFKVVPAELML